MKRQTPAIERHRDRSTRWSCATSVLTVALLSGAGCANGNGGILGQGDATPTDTAPAPDIGATDASDELAADVAPTPDAEQPPVDVSDAAPTPDVTRDVAPVDAGCGATWPSCDARPPTAAPATIAELWAADPTSPSLRWVSGAVVTAISHGACNPGFACQIYVQEPTGATTLAEATHHAIKVFVSSASASRFAGIHVNDRVDIAASAWRYNIAGQNELLLQVADSCALRGCMTRTGDGVVSPVPATLDALGSVMAYEYTYGPILVRLNGVSATTDMTTPLDSTTGGLFVTGAALDAGRSEPISVSPFFMPGGHFVGYTAGQRLRFTTLTGVFGMFIPSTAAADGGVTKYLQVYPRATSDIAAM